MRNENGFTLIELLFVLAIIFILTSLSTRISIVSLHKQYENYFFSTLSHDIRYAQNLSMNDKTADVRIHFTPHSYRIVSEQINFNTLTRSLPDGWSIETRSFSIVAFTARGSLKYSGTVYINTPHARFSVVFPLGKGSYYVTKQ